MSRFKNFFKGENLEVLLLIIGVVFAYNAKLLFSNIQDQRVMFMIGVSFSGTPLILLLLYYRKLTTLFARIIVLMLILLTIKELIGGILWLMEYKDISFFNNFEYGFWFWMQILFALIVILISFLKSLKINVVLYSLYTSLNAIWGGIFKNSDFNRTKKRDKSVRRFRKTNR